MTDERSPLPPARPIPAREAASGPGEEAPETTEHRTLFWDGVEWEIHLLGATRSGWGRDPGVTLLSLRFTPAEGSNRTVREALVPARDLASAPLHVLEEALSRR